MARLLDRFTDSGGLVVSLKSECEHVFAKDGSHHNKRIEGPNQARFVTAQSISEAVSIIRSRIKLPFAVLRGPDRMEHSLSSYPARIIDPYVHDGERVYGIGVTRYLKNGKRLFNVTN
jgi:hypothetical protein